MTFQDLITKGQTFWESIPGPIRTVINVVVGAAIVAGGAYLKGLNGQPIDWHSLWTVAWGAGAVALFRAINPLDALYGFGKNLSGQNTIPVTGDSVDTVPPVDAQIEDAPADVPADPPADPPVA